MAYPYPNYYQPPYGPYIPQQFYPQPTIPPQQNVQQPAPQPVQPPQQQIQNGGFMSVRSEEEAYNWPIAPGVGMTFKVENAPVIIDKARGFSPLEQPVVKVYDMIERVPQQQQSAAAQPQEAPIAPPVDYAERADVEAIRRELEGFKADLEALKNQPIVAEIKRATAKKKEVEE